jgi:tight adherence protein B
MSGPPDLEMIALVAFALVGLIGLMLLMSRGGQRKHLKRRLAKLLAGADQSVPGASQVTLKRDNADSSIQALDKLIKRLLPRPVKLRERLAATGKRIALAEFLLASLLAGFVAFLVLNLWLEPPAFISLLLALAAMLALPNLIVARMIGKRQRAFLTQFPEAIELMVRGLKSGVPVSESIKVVGQEMPDPVGAEFRALTDAMIMGQSFDEALRTVSKRLDLPEFRFFEISLGIQRETGGNLSETLENLATILRRRKQMKLKVRALSSEARASAYILGALPFLVFGALNLLSPDFAGVLIHDPRGHVIVGLALGLLGTGVGTMIKMGKFEI